MYAITHTTTALLIKRRWPSAGLWPLLISVQAIELLWVLFVYTGIERPEYTANAIHLNFLPYSHSVGSTMLVALGVWAYARYGMGNRALATALAVGVMSHVILDIIHHEPNIMLLPAAVGPRLGLNLQGVPLLDFVVELLYCVACWWIFRGTIGLLVGIVVLSLMNLPLMFPRAGTGTLLARHPAILPTVILAQIVMAWVVVWYLARMPRATGRGADSPPIVS
ncbi:MAG TPA: hypothetical protein VH539_17300 [Gemmatimonadaceae bacterium]|jgi:hypothetical protein